MLNAITAKHEGYQAEAVASDAIVLATFLNPRFWICFFDLNHPDDAPRAKEIFNRAFEGALSKWPEDPVSTTTDSEEIQPPSTSPDPNFSKFNVFTTHVVFQSAADQHQEEHTAYIEGFHLLHSGQNELDWWRVSPSVPMKLNSPSSNLLVIYLSDHPIF